MIGWIVPLSRFKNSRGLRKAKASMTGTNDPPRYANGKAHHQASWLAQKAHTTMKAEKTNT